MSRLLNLVIASTLFSAATANAAGTRHSDDVYHACKGNTAKVAISAQMANWSYTKKQWDFGSDVAVNARKAVLWAFSPYEDELANGWPGFMEWATLQLIAANGKRWTSKELEERLYLSCVERFAS